MNHKHHRNASLLLAYALLSAFCQFASAEPLVAELTYEGQEAELSKMPVDFEGKKTFITSVDTALCEVQPPKHKLQLKMMTLAAIVDAALRRQDRWEHVIQSPSGHPLKYYVDIEACQNLKAGTSIEVVGGLMNHESCLSAWMSAEYNQEWPGTSKYACFYLPLTKINGQLFSLSGMPLIGFDEWAAKEWKLTKK